jgi:hypothetical protein
MCGGQSELKFSGEGQSKLESSGNGNECKPLNVGLVSLIQRVAPNLPIHGSTQMSITSPEGAEFARELGCKRVVVGRELSIRDIAAVRAGTGAEVEAFVHGRVLHENYTQYSH